MHVYKEVEPTRVYSIRMYMILIISLIASLHVLHGFNLRVGQNGEYLETRRWQAKDLPMDCLHPAGLHRRGL